MKLVHTYAAVLACTSTAAFAQDAVQWRVEDGGNGHWYLGVASGTTSWIEAQEAAGLLGGYLATLTDEFEDEFVRFQVAEDLNLWHADTIRGPWIGGLQISEQDCDWRWVTGETWEFTNWHPDNPDGPCPQAVQLWVYQNRLWQNNHKDDPTRSVAFLVEWDADCNGDGIVDYGQILDGTFEDVDGNGVPDCCDQGTACGCRVDLNGDDLVDTQDFLVYLNLWVQRDPIADWDGNDEINSHDVLVFLNDWNQGC